MVLGVVAAIHEMTGKWPRPIHGARESARECSQKPGHAIQKFHSSLVTQEAWPFQMDFVGFWEHPLFAKKAVPHSHKDDLVILVFKGGHRICDIFLLPWLSPQTLIRHIEFFNGVSAKILESTLHLPRHRVTYKVNSWHCPSRR